MSLRLSVLFSVLLTLFGCQAKQDSTLCVGSQQEIPVTNTETSESLTPPSAEPAHTTSRRAKRVIRQTRNAVVEVYNPIKGARGTGTYFEFKDRHIVITAAHVVDGANVLNIVTPRNETASALVMLFDLRTPNDYAVLVLEKELETRVPMELKLRERTDQLIGENLIYTGNPGHHKNMTFFGRVSGFETDGSILMHSYTWGGASGSGVFDERGRLVGVLKAVDMNRNRFSPYPQITEDMVWLAPAWGLNLNKIEALLKIQELINEFNNMGDD